MLVSGASDTSALNDDLSTGLVLPKQHPQLTLLQRRCLAPANPGCECSSSRTSHVLPFPCCLTTLWWELHGIPQTESSQFSASPRPFGGNMSQVCLSHTQPGGPRGLRDPLPCIHTACSWCFHMFCLIIVLFRSSASSSYMVCFTLHFSNYAYAQHVGFSAHRHVAIATVSTHI